MSTYRTPHHPAHSSVAVVVQSCAALQSRRPGGVPQVQCDSCLLRRHRTRVVNLRRPRFHARGRSHLA
jgi:hypothetical protein